MPHAGSKSAHVFAYNLYQAVPHTSKHLKLPRISVHWGGNPGGDGFIDLVEFQAIAKNVKLNEDLRPDDDKVYILGTTNHANIATAAGSCNSAVLGVWCVYKHTMARARR